MDAEYLEQLARRKATRSRKYFFVVGWTKDMALPSYVDGPFLSYAEARDASVDWLTSERADAHSVMETVPQVAWSGSRTVHG